MFLQLFYVCQNFHLEKNTTMVSEKRRMTMSRYCPITQSEQSYLQCQECGNDKKCEYFFCIVAGSRQFNNYDLLCDKLDFLLQNQGGKVIIIHGGCRGADLLAERYAQHRGYEQITFLAEWDKYGKRAGYIRNREMHKFIAHFSKRGVVAFWDGKSKGTAHSFELANEFKNNLKVVRF